MRVAVVGCGLIGSRRARVAVADPRTSVELVIDVREEAAAALGTECGCRWSVDWRAGLGDPAIDLVIVSTSNDQLAPVATAALAAGKHVLIEKPMGRTLSEARALQRAARESGRALKVGFNHRYHPGIARALTLVREDRVGHPINARARYGHGGRPGYDKEWRGRAELAGGGELTDQGVHVLDLFQALLGAPLEVFCRTQTAVWPVAPLEDNAWALLSYPGGAVASFHTSWTQWKNLFSLEVFGTEGYVSVEGLGGSYGVETLTLGRRRPEGGVPDLERESFPGPDESWREEWREFVDAVAGGTPYQGTPEDGVAVMRVLDALYRSAKQGTIVRVDAST